jgi:hypothetical protein
LNEIFNGLLDIKKIYRYCKDKEKFLKTLGQIHEMGLEFCFSGIMADPIKINDHIWDPFDLQLNTIVDIGSDSLIFVARVHAQCEIHGYVMGNNREWLANIIEKGLDTKILREETQGYGKGWRDVIELLKKDSETPVVMDYSVTESFPHAPPTEFECICSEEAENNEEDCPHCGYYIDFDELSYKKQWEKSFKWLRECSESLEMKPENWSEMGFGDGKTVFDLIKVLENLYQ